MLFRQKTPSRALEELRWLVERYGTYTQKVIASDNIMPFDFLRKFLPRLKELNLKLDLFYESKSNLHKKDIQLFRDVGLCTFQPGIESLSTPVLRLMRKGVTGLQNIQLLKWCRQFGVKPSWNYLLGFPGERPEHYRGQEQVILSIEHLCPPSYCGPIRFDRFSPYFTDPARFGISNLRPYPSYRFIYPNLNEHDLFDIAYFFVGEFEGQTEVDSYTRAVRNAVAEWQASAPQFNLFAFNAGSLVLVWDTRGGRNDWCELSKAEQFVLDACDAIASRNHLLRRASASKGAIPNTERLDEVLAGLIEKRFLLCDEQMYLSVVIPFGEIAHPDAVVSQDADGDLDANAALKPALADNA